MDDEQQRLAREVARRTGLPGIPVSMREPVDAPGDGVGDGHWARRVRQLDADVAAAAAAAAQVPAGGVRDELERLLGVLRLRALRYRHLAEVGQARAPDDDSTDADGTPPGIPPQLHGAAADLDARLARGHQHLRTVARAVREIALALAGGLDPELLGRRLRTLFDQLPPA